MELSIAIVAWNEEKNLPAVLHDILAQGYPHEKIELLLIDSMSEDGTKAVMESFAERHAAEFRSIQVMENPGKILSRGWNRAIDAFTTEALVRVDAHSSIPSDFIEKNVAALEAGEYVTGGARPYHLIGNNARHHAELKSILADAVIELIILRTPQIFAEPPRFFKHFPPVRPVKQGFDIRLFPAAPEWRRAAAKH